jgi:hypothetical protein
VSWGKLVVNTALNAKTRNEAIAACFQEILLKNKQGWKRGNALARARRLRAAVTEIVGADKDGFYKRARNLISEIYDLAIRHHKPIAADFGEDAGASFMRVESAVALDVLYELAQQGIPALGIHDSFVVPATCERELEAAMYECYRRRLGFNPEIK